MAGKLEGKVALITGAGGGIGRAGAVAFVQEGAAVVVAEIDAERGEETVRLARETGGRATFVQTDVTQPEAVEAAVAAALREYGRLDVMYNNAGFSMNEEQGVVDTPIEVWNQTYSVNLFGSYLFCKYAIPELAKAGGGSIISTASVAGLAGAWKKHAYATAKAGIIGLTRTIALEYAAQGIRANAICPGVTMSPRLRQRLTDNPALAEGYRKRQPLGLCEPEDIAATALFLASDDSRMITGQYIVVDGGHLLDTGRVL
ncbi:MAG: SDR family oxidoreductase [Chloroflexi bacterium]|nr:SDR family oxidoreductase [Chloroflexota bacterium]